LISLFLDDDELKLKRGPGRPPKDRHSLPGVVVFGS
jgi:hypothetical protein